MQDLLIEAIALQRIALFAKLVAKSECSDDEKDVAIAWLDELSSDLSMKLNRLSSAQLAECRRLIQTDCRSRL